MGGLADIPENYKKVTYEIAKEKNGTRITVIQDNNATEDERKHTEENWGMVLAGLKELLEAK